MAMEVNKLIGKHILSKEPLHLPSIGSLYLVVEGTTHVVKFSHEQMGRSLVDVILVCASCTQVQAQDIYDRWLAESKSDDVLYIDGIGNLKANQFTAVEPFNTRLRDVVADEVENDVVVPVVVPETVAEETIPQEEEAKPESNPEPEVVVEPEPEPKQEEVVVPPVVVPEPKKDAIQTPKPQKQKVKNRESQQDSYLKKQREEEMKEQKSKKRMWVILLLLLLIIVGYFGYQYWNAQVEEKARVELAAQREAEAKKREADSLAKIEADAKRLAEEQSLAKESVQLPRFMVVYGVFTLEANAHKAVKLVKRDFNVKANIHPFEGKFLVSVFESESRAKCQNFLMTHYNDLTDSWIYEIK